mgnify:CR=1 FL=1
MTQKFIDDGAYLHKICQMLREIEENEMEAIEQAALAAYNSIKNGGLLHVFSTGHSHMIVEELFYRAGGLIPINPILSSDLMLHEKAITSTLLERMPGKAEQVLKDSNLSPGDTIIISSNSGINIVPVEAAIYAKSKGLTVVCITSRKVSEELEPRHPAGLKLFQVSDIVIDNHAPMGDGLLEVPGSNQLTGGASTFGSLFIGQRIVLKIENMYIAEGKTPPIYMSANLPGGDDYNQKIIDQYKGRIRALC